MPSSRSVLTHAVLALALAAGCGAPAPAATEPSAAAPTPPPTTSTTPSATTTGTTTDPAGTLPADGVGAASWVMPDLVGENLQDAQDAVQALTDFGIAVTTSTDATGAGRLQVVDRNWTVCAQNVAPGATITADTRIEFAAVKLDESC